MYLLVLLRIPGLMNQDTLVVLIQHPERFSITCTLGQRTAAGNTAREADSTYGLMAMDALRPGLWAMDVHVFPIRPFQYKYCHLQKALRRDCRQSPWYLSSSFTAPLLLSWREVSAELCSRAVESSGIATDLCSHHLAVALYRTILHVSPLYAYGGQCTVQSFQSHGCPLMLSSIKLSSNEVTSDTYSIASTSSCVVKETGRTNSYQNITKLASNRTCSHGQTSL